MSVEIAEAIVSHSIPKLLSNAPVTNAHVVNKMANIATTSSTYSLKVFTKVCFKETKLKMDV